MILVLLRGYIYRANVPAITSIANYASKKEDEVLSINEAPQISITAALKPEELQMRKNLEGTITIRGGVRIL